MHAIAVTFLVVVVLRLLLEQRSRGRHLEGVGLAVREEAKSLFLVVAGLVGMFALILVFTLFFGPIPPIHEW